ncbi:MAG: DUF1016 domain-containing protein [Bacilli bacterium]|nr:DUF1016 domain-containing protein [Bacilli bacterium]
MNYYDEIKDTLIRNEVYKKAKDYSKNRSDLNSYYEVGRLLVDAQGGEERAKYGNKLIKDYSERLTRELGKGYNITSLKGMRQLYLKSPTLSDHLYHLNWSQVLEIIYIDDIKEANYYIYITKNQSLSVRELRKRIKANEYERIGYKEELSEPKVNTLIKDPVIINTKKVPDKVTELFVHNSIMEDMDNFLKQLGIGFTYVGHEVKIQIGENKHSIDFLLFNYKFNCFVVVEIKAIEFKAEHIGQVMKYMGYVDNHIKESFNNKTIGIIMCLENDGYVFKYIKPDGVFVTTYELINN